MKRFIVASLACMSVLATTSIARATTYAVGPGKTYANLGAVASLLAPGDVVNVDGNATYPSVLFAKSGTKAAPITIRGVTIAGKRPVISGGTNSIEVQGDHYVLENLEVTGGASRCIYHHSDDLTVRSSVVHDCPTHGILGADNDSGSLLLEFVEVYRCGEGTQHHQIYIATDEDKHPGSVFRMQHCYVHDATGGNNVKSRAERGEFYYNWIEGALYHELELIGPDPAGGTAESKAREDSDIVGNVLRKTGLGPTSYVTRIGGDGTGQTNGRYRFVNNTIIMNAGGSAAFRIFDGIESVEMHNNVLFVVGGGKPTVFRSNEAVWVSGPIIVGTNNWLPTGTSLTDGVGVTAAWTGTVFGADPGFADLATFDLKPTATSGLVDKGGPATAGPSGHAFPSPLPLPLYVPPVRVLAATATGRPLVSTIDIGAYEYGTGPTPTPDAGTDSGPGTDSGVNTDASPATDASGDSSKPGGDTGSTTDAKPGEDAASTYDSALSLDDDGGLSDALAGDSGSCSCDLPGHTRDDSLALFTAMGLGVGLVAARRRRATAH
jgi:hypothetical protein